MNNFIRFQISADDGMPHSVCNTCIDRVNYCVESLDIFRAAQERNRANFIDSVLIS